MAKKVVMFDMDGVLFDSMPVHSRCWVETLRKYGIDVDEREVYLTEGMTGRALVPFFWKLFSGQAIEPSRVEGIYQEKASMTEAFGMIPVMPGALEAVRAAHDAGAICTVVTGSAMDSIIGGIDREFKGLFDLSKTVCALDVKHCKPDPEPYLKGLEKAGVRPEEAIVVENAPMGVRSARAAGIFTIAVNTGILEDSCLLDEAPDALYRSMEELSRHIAGHIR